MVLIRMIFSLAFLLSSMALGAACETPQMTIRVWQKIMPGARIAYVTGPRAQRIIAAFKGPTAAGNEVVVAYPPRGPKVAVAMYQFGCATDRVPIDRRLIERILKFKGKAGQGV